MKKNKLSFLIVSSLLAIATLVGCNSSDESSSSKAGDSNSIASSESSQANPASSSSNSQGAQSSSSSVQPISSSQGTSSGQQSTGPQSSVGPQSSSGQSQGSSQGDSSSGQSQGDSSSQGGSQETKTDWTNEEKQAIQAFLHGEVIPFIPFDVTFNFNAAHQTVSIESKANMPEGFLRTYLQAFYELDSGWEVQDVSTDYNADYGSCYMAKKAVQENGQTRYVAVAFFGGDYDEVTHSMTCSSTGKFYLEATDPYVYEYPAEFIGEWLGQSFGTTIVPPDMHAEYYSLNNEGILIAYSETNLEDAYKRILLGTGQFNIDANKDSLGFIVTHPTDGSYTMKFKYDASEKAMILTVEGPKGWNNSAINAIFTKNNVTPFSLASISDPNIQFNAIESSAGGQAYLSIIVGGVDVQTVKTYINDLKTLGYKVAFPDVVVENNQYFTTVNIFTNEGMYTAYVSYSTSENANSLSITISLVPNTTVTKIWPTEAIASYVTSQKDVVPAFSDKCYGYSYSSQDLGYVVVVHVDEGTEADAQAAYIATLTGAGYVRDGSEPYFNQPRYKSRNGDVHVSVGCDATQIPGEIDLLIQNITVVDTPWPSEAIANAIKTKLLSGADYTDTLPALNVASADECYIGNNYINEFEVRIEGIGADFERTAKEALKNANYIENQYYDFDYEQKGALISPNKQFAVHVYTVGNDVMLAVKDYWAPSYKVVGLGNNWNYDESLLLLSDATKQEEVDKGCYVSQLKAEFNVVAEEQFKVTDGGEWYGYSIIEPNDKFTLGKDGNIKANEDGHVVVYFKTYADNTKGMALVFTPEAAEEPIEWPEDSIDGILEEWELEGENIPGVESAIITDVSVTADTDNFEIKLEGGADLLDDYLDLLGKSNYNLEEDPEDSQEYWFSFSGKIALDVYAQDDDLYIVVYLKNSGEESNEYDCWPEPQLVEFFDNECDFYPYSAKTEAVYSLTYSPEDAPFQYAIVTITVDNDGAEEAMDDAINAILMEHGYNPENLDGYYNYVYNVETGVLSSPLETAPTYEFGLIDENSFAVKVHFNKPENEEPAEWPQEEIEAIMVDIWEDDDVIPEIDNENITDIEVIYSAEDFPNSFTIKLYGCGDLSTEYEELIADGFEFDRGEGFWISASGKTAVNFFEDDGDFFIEVGLIEQEAETASYNLYNDNDWDITADNALIYAYVWGGEYDSGQFILLTYDEANDCYVLEDIDLSAEGFKIVRINPRAEEPGWGEGVLWNETGDMDFPEIGGDAHFSF